MSEVVETLRVAASDGFPLAVQVSGPAGAPVLLLLPGQANSHAWWEGVREAFETAFRTVTFDYRGTGASRGPVGPWSMAQFAHDAADVLDQVNAGQAVVYGTSMGGRVTQLLAASHPERVTALVLACTSPGGPHAIDRGPEVRSRLARADAAQRRKILHELFYTPDWPHGPGQSTLLGDASMTGPEAAAHLRASDNHDAWDLLPSITAPALVLHGEDDQMTPVENAGLLAERIPGAQVRTYAGGRHGFFEEFAPTVNADIRQFLQSLPVPRISHHLSGTTQEE